MFSITITRGVDYVMNHTNYTLSVLLLPCTLRATLDIPSLYRHSRDCPRQPTLTPSSSSFSLFLFFSILLFFLLLLLSPCLDSQEVHGRSDSFSSSETTSFYSENQFPPSARSSNRSPPFDESKFRKKTTRDREGEKDISKGENKNGNRLDC